MNEEDFVIKRKRIDKALRIACKKVEWNTSGIMTYGIISQQKRFNQGVDIPTVSKLLGHADGGALANEGLHQLNDRSFDRTI